MFKLAVSTGLCQLGLKFSVRKIHKIKRTLIVFLKINEFQHWKLHRAKNHNDTFCKGEQNISDVNAHFSSYQIFQNVFFKFIFFYRQKEDIVIIGAISNELNLNSGMNTVSGALPSVKEETRIDVRNSLFSCTLMNTQMSPIYSNHFENLSSDGIWDCRWVLSTINNPRSAIHHRTPTKLDREVKHKIKTKYKILNFSCRFIQSFWSFHCVYSYNDIYLNRKIFQSLNEIKAIAFGCLPKINSVEIDPNCAIYSRTQT